MAARAQLLVVALVIVAACGGDDDDDDSTARTATGVETTVDTAPATTAPDTTVPDTTAPDTSAPDTTTPDTTAPDTTAPDTTVRRVVWVPTGPGDPLIPDQYGGLVPGGNKDCDALSKGPNGEDPNSFWGLAEQICFAVLEGADWPDVDSLPQPPQADGPFAACLDVEVASVMREALQWHLQRPNDDPEVAFSAEGSLSDCERPIYLASAIVVGQQDFQGGKVGDVRVEFEIPTRPNADDSTAELDGKPVMLRLDGDNTTRGTRKGQIILGPEWATGETVQLVVRGPRTIERRTDVELPVAEAGTTTTTSGGAPRSTTTSTTTTVAAD